MDPSERQSERLFDGRHLRVTRRGEAPLWATFDNHDPARRGFDPLRSEETAMAAGYAPCQVQTAANDWYLNPDLDPALAALRPMGGRGLGISMGAFGAILFAAALGLEELILVSPRFPDTMGWPRRARVYAKDPPEGWQRRLKPAARKLPPSVVLYDPHHRDDRYTLRWLTEINPRVRAIAVPFGDHPATSLFREAEAWGPLQQLFLTAPFADLPAGVAQLRRQVRLRSASYRARVNQA